jgi:hypothetical protein
MSLAELVITSVTVEGRTKSEVAQQALGGIHQVRERLDSNLGGITSGPSFIRTHGDHLHASSAQRERNRPPTSPARANG